MSDPAGGPPPPQDPSNWQAPPPTPTGQGGFQAATIEPGPAPGVAYADLVTRVIAYIIDAILFGVVFAIVFAVVGAILLAALLAGGALLALVGFAVLAVLSLVGSAVYFVYTWTTMRASPGQRILGLETVSAANGATLTRDQAIRRWAYLFGPSALAIPAQLALNGTGLDFLSPVISLAGLLYTLYLLYTASQSPKRQGFHDVQSGTVVIKRT